MDWEAESAKYMEEYSKEMDEKDEKKEWDSGRDSRRRHARTMEFVLVEDDD